MSSNVSGERSTTDRLPTSTQRDRWPGNSGRRSTYQWQWRTEGTIHQTY